MTANYTKFNRKKEVDSSCSFERNPILDKLEKENIMI
jgi:hypothetical protein